MVLFTTVLKNALVADIACTSGIKLNWVLLTDEQKEAILGRKLKKTAQETSFLQAPEDFKFFSEITDVTKGYVISEPSYILNRDAHPLGNYLNDVDVPPVDNFRQILKCTEYGLLGPREAHLDFFSRVIKNSSVIPAVNINTEVPGESIIRCPPGADPYGDTFRKQVIKYLRLKFRSDRAAYTKPYGDDWCNGTGPWESVVASYSKKNPVYIKSYVRYMSTTDHDDRKPGKEFNYPGFSYLFASKIVDDIGFAKVFRLLKRAADALKGDEYPHCGPDVNIQIYKDAWAGGHDVSTVEASGDVNKLKMWLARVMLYVAIGALGGPHEIFVYFLLKLCSASVFEGASGPNFGLMFINYYQDPTSSTPLLMTDIKVKDLPTTLIKPPAGPARVPVSNREAFTISVFLSESEEIYEKLKDCILFLKSESMSK